MIEQTTRIRKVYQPLSLTMSVGIEGVSANQVVNPSDGATSPMRSQVTPTRLVPKIYAYTGAKDPSWTDGSVNAILAEVKWLANGVDIADSAAWREAGSNLYSISTAADGTRGTITIWKNLAASEQYDMQMKAKFLDSRTGRYYEVLTDAVTLSAQALGDSEWDFSIVHDVNILYNPLLDRLRVYDWLVSKGKAHASRESYLDSNAYDVSLPILVTHGHNRYTPDSHITFELQDHLDSHKVITPSASSYITSLTKSTIKLDLRKLPQDHVVVDVIMKADGTFQSQEQITITRTMPKVELLMLNDADIDLGASTRWDKARIVAAGNALEYPEAYFDLTWMARSSANGVWYKQTGAESVTIDQSSLGISPTGSRYLGVWLKAEVIDGGSASYESFSVKHKVYAPLSIVTTVAVSGKPIVQTDADDTDKRTETNPTILTPTVTAISTISDASWTDGKANGMLTQKTWLVNGADISRVFAGEYSIASDGTLHLWHNCKHLESHSLQFSAMLTDSRTGNRYHILSDEVVVISQNRVAEAWDFSVVHDVNIQYNPLKDRLKLYDYLVEHGISASKSSYLDSSAYDLSLPILVTYGHNKKAPTDSITFRLFEHESGEELTKDDSLLVSDFTKSVLRLDLRFLPSDTLVLDLCMYVSGKLRQIEQLTFKRVLSRVEVFTLNCSDVDLTASTRWDKAVVTIDGEVCTYPEAYVDIFWEARAAGEEQWHPQGAGASVTIRQSELNTTGDIEVRVGYAINSALAAIADESGRVITNQTGDILINWV